MTDKKDVLLSKSEDSTSFYVVLRKEAEFMDDARRAGFVNVAKYVEESTKDDEVES
ncbi:hypothetical protein [Waltera sp.]|uniref:hypothetical protein n=1 Tax=Waltera sp. TaxID=2815806 RepID=UPI003993C4F8